MRALGQVLLGVVVIATALVALTEVLARASLSGAGLPLHPPAHDLALADADLVTTDERIPAAERLARAVVLRPRDPRLLASLAAALHETDEAEAVRLRLLAARVAPYDGRLSAASGERLLEAGRAHVAREGLERERARRAAGRPGADEHVAAAAAARASAERAFSAVVELGAITGPSVPARRFVDEHAEEARRHLDDLRESR